MRIARVLGVTSILAVACGPATPNAATPVSGPYDELERLARAFDRLEEEVLRDLAAVDRRLAMRAHITPSEGDLRRVAMAAMLREDPTVAIVDGSIDPFSFDARARGLEAAKRKVPALPANADTKASERDLLSRLLDAESTRLEEERALPRSASSLVRAIVDTWRPPKTEREVDEDDRWLARRLSELRKALTTSNPAALLDVVRARELDDALDALERLISTPGFTATMDQLVRLREALETAGSRPPEGAHSEWPVLARRLRSHLGVSASSEDLARDLAALEADLRSRAERALAASGLGREALAAALEKSVFVAGPCMDAVPGSRVRSMAAPPEREPACHLRHLVARGEDDTARAVALAAMHDHVVVAEWALDVARGASMIAKAEDEHRLFVPVLPDTRARYERIALARPVAAIGAGETARLLVAGDPKGRAMAWSPLGDLPLDVAAKELDAMTSSRTTNNRDGQHAVWPRVPRGEPTRAGGQVGTKIASVSTLGDFDPPRRLMPKP